MELFSKLFLIGSTGLFLAFLLHLIDHPKRIQIGVGIYLLVILLIVSNSPLLAILYTLVGSPFIIFLDYKRINWKKGIIYVAASITVLFITSRYLIHFIPFYIYPVFVFAYVLIAKKNSPIHIEENVN